MTADLQARLDELARGLVRPLLYGGSVKLSRPLGPQLGLMLGAHGREISDLSLRSEIDLARVRQLRRLLPIDVVPPISPAEWSLLSALNDLMQVTNHQLSSGFSRRRHLRLLEGVGRLVDAVSAPRTTLEVLMRHATLARIGELVRVDTLVRWWTGSRIFRGEKPDSRLLLWPDLRRVSQLPQRVPLANMLDGLRLVSESEYLDALGRIYAASPLTDLVNIGRTAPAFRWGSSNLGLISYPVGRTLVLRALTPETLQVSLAALRRENGRLPEGRCRSLCDDFAAELAERASGTAVVRSA